MLVLVHLWICFLTFAPNPTRSSSEVDRQSIRPPLDGDEHVETGLLHGAEVDRSNRQALKGSRHTEEDRFPYLCSLRMSGSRKHVCTATLVDGKWLVTAAHCVDPNYPGSTGCYPLVYCGTSRINAPTADKTFHVVETYMHEDWMGTIFYGSDIAMLKLDRNAKQPVPRLYREGMYLVEELDVPSTNWDVKRRLRAMSKTPTTSATSSTSSVTVRSDDVCQMQREIISSKGWLCASESAKETCDDGAGNPLLVTDRPRGRLMDGFPAEDLLAAVKSFDASDPKCQSCSVYTSVAYFREWMVRTIKGRSEPSRCSLSPKYEPQERIPAGWRQTRPLCKSETSEDRPVEQIKPKKKKKHDVVPAATEQKGDIKEETDLIEESVGLSETGPEEAPAQPWTPKRYREQAAKPEKKTQHEQEGVDVVTSGMEHTEKFDKQTAAGPEVTERPDAGPEVIQEVDLLISEVTEMPIDSVTPGEIEETEVSSDEPMDDGGDDDFLDVETSAPAPESYPAEVWDLLSMMLEAIRIDDDTTAAKVLRRGLDPNSKSMDEESFLDKESTLLHWTATFDASRCAKVILDKGGDANAVDLSIGTPLHKSATYGYAEVTKILLSKGAKVDARDKSSRTPLRYAATYGNVEVTKILVEHKADVEAVDDSGWTPLYFAANYGYADVAQVLLNAGAIVDVTDKTGWTPIYTAASNGHAEVTQVLLDGGADVNATNDAGWTPLHSAAGQENVETVKVLLDAGAYVRATDTTGWTALHCAARWGRLETAELLIAAGASKSSRDDIDRTPLDCICEPTAFCSEETRSALTELLTP